MLDNIREMKEKKGPFWAMRVPHNVGRGQVGGCAGTRCKEGASQVSVLPLQSTRFHKHIHTRLESNASSSSGVISKMPLSWFECPFS